MELALSTIGHSASSGQGGTFVLGPGQDLGSPVHSVTLVYGLDREKLVDVRGFEPLTPCLQSDETKSILLVRLVLFRVLVRGLAPILAAIGPKLDPSFGMNP
jgi:hypothetical protein